MTSVVDARPVNSRACRRLLCFGGGTPCSSALKVDEEPSEGGTPLAAWHVSFMKVKGYQKLNPEFEFSSSHVGVVNSTGTVWKNGHVAKLAVVDRFTASRL